MSFLGGVVLPSVIFIGIFMHNYCNYILESTVSEKQNVLHEINKNLNQYLYGYKDTSMNIYYNSSIRSYLNMEEHNEETQSISTFLTGIVNSEKYIAAAVMEIGEHTYQAGYKYLNLEESLEQWRPVITQRKGRVVWIPTTQFSCAYGQKPYQFVMARAVNSPNESIGILLFFISSDLFSECFNNPVFLKQDTECFIVDNECRVVYSNREGTMTTIMDNPMFRKILKTGTGNFVYRDSKTREKSIVVCEKSSLTGWNLVTVTKEREAYGKLYTILKMAGIIGTLYVGFMVLAYYILSVYVFEPVNRLGKGMKHVSAGEFRHIEVDSSSSNEDEISYTILRYNDMVDQIEKLLIEVREEEMAKNEERMKVLSMQISPHFVYNTLNTIKWMAAANRQENISKMIESLIKMMRSVTCFTNEEIKLKDELELLESYVYIQKIRFQNFEVEYEVPEEFLELKISKLILQPFVENCIQHAFGEKEDLGIIRIIAKRNDNRLEICIVDNGKGFDVDETRERCTQVEEKDHVGIKNVSERIRMNYGEQYGVTIKSVLGQGTRVVICLPLTLS